MHICPLALGGRCTDLNYACFGAVFTLGRAMLWGGALRGTEEEARFFFSPPH